MTERDDLPDDRITVRGLSAVLPPNEPDQLDLEVTLGETRVLYRITRRSRDWAMLSYQRAPDGVHRGKGYPFESLQDAVYRVLIDPLLGRLLEDDHLIEFPGTIRRYNGPLLTEPLEEAEKIFGRLVNPPQRPTIGGPLPGPDDSRFLGWISGPERAVPHADGHLRVLGVELYEEGIAINWLLTDASRPREPKRDEHSESGPRVNPDRISISDNTRRRYRREGGNAQFGARHVKGRYVCGPGVGSDAKWLNVTIEGHRFRIELPNTQRAET